MVELVVVLFDGGELPGEAADVDHFDFARGGDEDVLGSDIAEFLFLFLKFFSAQQHLVHEEHEFGFGVVLPVVLFSVIEFGGEEVADVLVGDLPIWKTLLLLGNRCRSSSWRLPSRPFGVRGFRGRRGSPCSFRGGCRPFPSSPRTRPHS